MAGTIILVYIVSRYFSRGHPSAPTRIVTLLNTVSDYITLFLYIPILRAFIPLYVCKNAGTPVADLMGGYCWLPGVGFSWEVLLISFVSLPLLLLFVPIALVTALNVFVEDTDSTFLLKAANARVDFTMISSKTIITTMITLLMPVMATSTETKLAERIVISFILCILFAILALLLRATQPYYNGTINKLRFASWSTVSFAALLAAVSLLLRIDVDIVRVILYGGAMIMVVIAFPLCYATARNRTVSRALDRFFRRFVLCGLLTINVRFEVGVKPEQVDRLNLSAVLKSASSLGNQVTMIINN